MTIQPNTEEKHANRFLKLRHFAFILLTLFTCTFSNSLFAQITGWITPANNELPLGSSTGLLQYVIENPVDFPAANQVVEVWLDSGSFRLYYAYNDGTTWIAPANNEIPLGLASGIYSFFNPVYDPSSGQLIIIWQASSQGPLYYAVYDGNSWTAPDNNQLPLGGATGVFGFNSPIATEQLMLIWEAEQNGPLYYAVYDGTMWIAPDNNQIPIGSSGGIRFFFDPCYNPATNQVIQIWQDTELTNIYYSAFDGTSWSPGSAIPLGLSSGVGYGAFSIPLYYSPTNQIIEIWQNTGTNGNLFYSVFNGTSWVTPANNELPLGASSGVGTQDFSAPVYDAAARQALIIWQDATNNLMYYASYNGTSWLAPTNNLIPLGASSEIYSYLDPIYDNSAGQVVFIWEESTTNLFYYATYNGTTWTAPINNTISLGLSTVIGVYRDPVYDTSSGQLLLLWQDFTNNNRIFYSTYDVLSPAPPSGFYGKLVKNKFLTQTDRINVLEWTLSPDPTAINYLLRRNGELIFVGSANGPFAYVDQNRKKNTIYTYTLTTQNQQGLESSPLIVTIKNK